MQTVVIWQQETSVYCEVESWASMQLCKSSARVVETLKKFLRKGDGGGRKSGRE